MEKEEKIINVYVVSTVPDKEDQIIFSGEKEKVRNYIGNYAFLNNNSQFIFSEKDGRYYYDCGEMVFYVTERIDLEMRDIKTKLGRGAFRHGFRSKR